MPTENGHPDASDKNIAIHETLPRLPIGFRLRRTLRG